MKKIRILELEASKGWGGQEKRTVRLVNHLNPEEFEVFFAVSPESELFKRKKEIKAEFFSLEIRNSFDLKAIFSVIKLVKKLKIDIISTHSGKDGWIGALAGKLTSTKVVRTRHLIVPIPSAISYNLSDKVVAISQAVKNRLIEDGVKPEKIEVIYTGIDLERFKPNFEKKRKNERIVVGIVAVLRAAKRHKLLIEAIKNLPDAELWIVGEGPQKKNLIEFVKKLNLEERIKFLGFQEKIEQIFQQIDIAVLPSEHEALGTALIEAQACGVPVIGSRVGGIPETLIEGKTGFLFEKDNLEELIDKLRILIENPEIRKKFGKAGRAFVEKKFSLEKMVRDTENLYKSLAL